MGGHRKRTRKAGGERRGGFQAGKGYRYLYRCRCRCCCRSVGLSVGTYPLVRLLHPRPVRLCLHRDGQEQEDRRVLLLPLVHGVSSVLLEHLVDVRPTDLHRGHQELFAHASDKLAGAATASIRIHALQIALDPLRGVVLEELHVHFSEHEIRHHDLLNDLLQRRLVLEELCVVGLGDDVGEEANTHGGQSVVLHLRLELRQ